MKSSTKEILEIINNDKQLERILHFVDGHPDIINIQETSLKDAYHGYLRIRELLSETIASGVFEEIPVLKRKQILAELSQISQHSKNPTQFISQFLELDDIVQLTGLWQRSAKDIDISVIMKEVMALRSEVRNASSDLRSGKEYRNGMKKFYTEAQELKENQLNILREAQEVDDRMEGLLEKTRISHTRIEKNDLEITERKQEIVAFHRNIESNEKKLIEILEELSKSVSEEINSKISRARELIIEAENALELKSTEGISRAYGERLTKLNKDYSKSGWLIGAGFFLIITLFLGLMLTGLTFGDLSWSSTDNSAVILGRIAMTGIGITAAVFCAKRYLYIKTLEEDYEYKVVLTKSILAFANKIKEIDEGRVAEYLNRVLIDLHQSPSRQSNNDKALDQKLLDLLDKYTREGRNNFEN